MKEQELATKIVEYIISGWDKSSRNFTSRVEMEQFFIHLIREIKYMPKSDELPPITFEEYWTPIIDKLKQKFSGSSDYMSGVNDGMHTIIQHIATPCEENI